VAHADHDVIPLLACIDIEAEHDFLIRALGFASAGVERAPDGTVVHAEVRMGSRRVWLHRVDEAGGLVPPRRAGTSGAGIVVHVPDVDLHHGASRAAGAEILYEPRAQDYGQREVRRPRSRGPHVVDRNTD